MNTANESTVLNLIYKVIDEVNQSLTNDKKIKKSTDTVLYGPNGGVDSLGMAIFIVALEQKLEKEFAITVSLAETLMNSPEKVPLRSIQSLCDYLTTLLKK